VYDHAIEHFRQVRNPELTPKFFLHWIWRMTAQLGLSNVWLLSGNILNARLEADLFLESALSTADPHMQALAWEGLALERYRRFDQLRTCTNEGKRHRLKGF
jgi:hypothetical protein